MGAQKDTLIVEAGDQLDTAVSDQTHHAPAPPQLEGPEPWGTRFMRSLGHNLHYLTFLPLVLLGVLQVFNVLLAAALSTAVACLILLLGFRCHKAGHVKIFPKPYDLFNLVLCASILLLALFARDWLRLYVVLLLNAGNACFMWATILLPCSDNFVMHSVRERVPDHVARLPLMRRMALASSLTWASALTVMSGGSALAIVTRLHPTAHARGDMIAATVLCVGPLLLALPVQLLVSHVYKKRLMRQKEAHDAAVAAQAAQPDIEEGKPGGNV